MDGKYIPISQGSILPTGLRVPQRDYFSTSTGGWNVDFKSCCGMVSKASVSANGSKGADGGISVDVIVLIIVGVIVTVAMALACTRPCCRRGMRRLCRKRVADASKLPKSEPLPAVNLPSFTLPEVPDAELGGAIHGQGKRFAEQEFQKLRAAASVSRGAPALPSMPPKGSDAYSHGVYEGPVHGVQGVPGWKEADDRGTAARERPWQVGDKVRLCGLGPQSTWNGVEATIVGIRKTGHLQIKLLDGRMQAVRPENCESLSPPMLTTGGWRGTAEMSHDATAGRFQSTGTATNFHNSCDTWGESMNRRDVGAGVSSWLASTPTSAQVSSNLTAESFHANSKLPARHATIADSLPTPSRCQQASLPGAPPVPPAAWQADSGMRSASSGPGRGAAGQAVQPAARRSVSSGPNDRRVQHGAPAARAMSLTPGGGSVGAPMCDLPQSQQTSPPRARLQPAPANHGLENDLMKAHKRAQAKLASLKRQVASPR